ncbi:MAG: hypothetical protein ACI8RD_006754 [Bacillariaceae sp.]|jgi:hypothetical protein
MAGSWTKQEFIYCTGAAVGGHIVGKGGGRREEGVIKPPSTDDNIDFSKI